MAYIYLIANDVNEKCYVGKTEKSLSRRFQEHCAESKRERNKNRPLYRAMNKYGVEHFSISLLEETNQPEEREIFWIKKLDTYHSGYNATRGGDGKKYLDYEEIYAAYCLYKNATEVARNLCISVDTVLAVAHQYGTVRSAQAVSKALKSKAIIMCNLAGEPEQIFESKHDAARYLQQTGITATPKRGGIIVHLNACANGKRKTAYKKIWKWKA